MKIRLLVALLVCVSCAFGDAPKSILLVAGKPSHGAGEHEFPSGCQILAKALDDSGLNLKTKIQYDTWPENGALDGIDVLVVYCDGDQKHVALGHEADLLRLSNRGAGIVFLHYAVDGEPGLLNETLMKVIGGYYNEGQSQNPEWTMKNPVFTEHAVTRGVQPFELKDEWYYNLKFSDVVPLMSAVPPEESQAYTLAWTYGSNAFGFTGGHFLSCWAQPDFRKLVLNAIVWSAGLEVPSGGIESADPIVVKNKTILHAIAKGDPDDVFNHLLLGADVNEPNKQGWTPLHFATVRGKTACAEVLIAKGATLDPRTGTKKTPLHFAGERGFFEITELLVESGADLTAQDDEGWSPLHYAAEKDKVDVAAYLIEQGAEVDMPSTRGGTPLHEASASASPEMIKLLLKNGADKNIKAANGKTPLDYAIELGNEPAEALLR
ncbi:ankyrin repeat domain-containing protein [Pontiella sulfatireligans]|uniref:Actin-binding protein n=1 Tax=Pontiella sulfatireligans TaxID=2750658 RepID=A0A6C2UHM9_9BACT|nr:ankyrin repeat domain-containing protein [Pontiella sulfatireligans]VGO19705.1 Actin-binding protein [Pontiella sulfatireligans]